MTYRRECDGMLALALALLVIAMVGLPVAVALAAQTVPRSPEACARLAQTFRTHPIRWPMPRLILHASECS